MWSSVGLLHDEAQLTILAVGWQPKAGERLLSGIVPVQHRRTSVVAVDCLLRLFFPGYRDILRVVARKPLGPVRGHCDDQRLLVFRKHGIARKIHRSSPLFRFDGDGGANSLDRKPAPKGCSPRQASSIPSGLK